MGIPFWLDIQLAQLQDPGTIAAQVRFFRVLQFRVSDDPVSNRCSTVTRANGSSQPAVFYRDDAGLLEGCLIYSPQMDP